MVCLGNEQRSFCRFWDCIQVLHFGLFCWLWWLLHFFWGILAHSGRCNGHMNWIHPFQSILVHRFLKCWCSLFAISCLTTSNLSWFVDLDIPGSYAVLFFIVWDLASITRQVHNWALLSLRLCLFILSGVISALFSRSILGTYTPGEFLFQCPIFLPFHTVHGFLKARILKWFAIPFSSGPHSVSIKVQLFKEISYFQKYLELCPSYSHSCKFTLHSHHGLHCQKSLRC